MPVSYTSGCLQTAYGRIVDAIAEGAGNVADVVAAGTLHEDYEYAEERASEILLEKIKGVGQARAILCMRNGAIGCWEDGSTSPCLLSLSLQVASTNEIRSHTFDLGRMGEV